MRTGWSGQARLQGETSWRQSGCTARRQAANGRQVGCRMAVGTSQQRASSGRQEGRARYRHGGHLFLSGAAVSSAANPPCYVFTNNGQAKDQQHLISDQTRRACVHVCTFGMALSLRQMMPRQAPSSGFFSQEEHSWQSYVYVQTGRAIG